MGGAFFGLTIEQRDEDEHDDNWADPSPDMLGFHEPAATLYDT
ncbi:hypothetical protein [Promicromonospora iranensis]|uniref:Uncharacterized protein n=1 Tax=Promicromonospora iranensis TaxID=1105144 RepID=A0ABU2CW07_9MICO|nr:hypothetical protein [Promicromonospora iranensis]MDR7385522.1 hypothetical protein [Promicromonospora iranensis]